MKSFQKKTNTPTTDNVSVAPTQLKSNPFLSGNESTANPFVGTPVQMKKEKELSEEQKLKLAKRAKRKEEEEDTTSSSGADSAY